MCDIQTFFLPGPFQQDSRGLFGIEASNNLHLFPLVPRLMKNAFTTCFASTGFSGVFRSLATCHWDCSWWKYDVRVTAFSASSISCCVIEVSSAEGIWAICNAPGGLPVSPHNTAAVKDEKPFLLSGLVILIFFKKPALTRQSRFKWYPPVK